MADFTPTKSLRVGNQVRTYFVQNGEVVFPENSDGLDLSGTSSTNVSRSGIQGMTMPW